MVFLIDGLAFHGLAAAAAADRERKVGVQRGAVHVAIVAFVVVASALPRTAAGEDWIYTVRPGDNLWDFARQHCADSACWRRLQEMNNVADPWRMPTGLRLRVPVEWLKAEPAPARVVGFRGEGTITPAGTAEQRPVSEGVLLHAGDTLTLSTSGSATLEFADGSQLLAGPSSVLRLDAVSAYGGGEAMVDTRVHLERGRSDADVKSRLNPSRFVIEAPAAVSAVRGTSLRVAVANHGATARTEVLSGTVEVSAAGGAVRVEQGFGVVTLKGGTPGAPRVLLPAPRLAPLPAVFDRLPVHVRVEPLPSAFAYRMEVSSTETFDDLLDDVVSEDVTLRCPDLPDGRYWVRVRAIDDQGLEGHDTAASIDIDARPEPPLLMEPIKEGKVREEVPSFRWAAPENARAYRFQLAKSQDLAAPVVERDAHEGASLRLDQPLSPGLYSWRVATVDAAGHAGPYSDFQAFEYKPAPEAPTPGPAESGEKSLVFRWRAGEPGQTYQIQIARDREFETIVLDRKSSVPQVSVPRPEPGHYFLRVRAIDADGYEGPFGAAQAVNIQEEYWGLVIRVFKRLREL